MAFRLFTSVDEQFRDKIIVDLRSNYNQKQTQTKNN